MGTTLVHLADVHLETLRHGFRERSPYEPYASMEPDTNASSVFMERSL